MSRKKPEHYVDNKKFYESILEHRENCKIAKEKGKEEPRLPEYIGECIWKIAKHLSYHPWFINYSFKDEMIGDGIENCFQYFHRFNPDKYKNPFAYFTQITYFAFRRRIMKEEKNRYIIYKNFETNIVLGGHGDLLVDSENNLLSPLIYDNIKEFLEKYEAKEKIKKINRKKAKELSDAKEKH
ncbi:MAG: sigma factor for late transcription [Candidatus Paceibacterota bacterium]